ncbi:DUF5691 domain-containing protein [Intrasporangium sp. YIM S08009]|uniref:DUF5691 domain-containing protein n=1 Tax=Intrasporangium zincisolvens TaxID=3080018 RepID=UPI002B055CBE|nr:DUF5691 domain-containing protein [Intrasporangium sp. YIM S08009]
MNEQPTVTRDFDAWWREVGNVALIGTARRGAPPLDVLGVRRPDAAADGPREGALLDAAALGAAALQSGRVSHPADTPPTAPPDVRPEASRLAVQLLELVMTQPPAGAQQRPALLTHWLRACDAGGQRVPHALLPTLLDLATAQRSLRRVAARVVDERGLWLAALRPEWSWVLDAAAGADVSAEPDVDPDDWARLPSAERVPVVASLRARDPDAARALVGSTWATDAARDRRAHLETFRVGLGPADEPLLERALDDRSAGVREVATELLDGLPGSARAARMRERLRPLVHTTGMLRRGLEVTLPDEPDVAGRRDGLGKQPPRRSARGWWLERIVAGAPLEVWTDTTGADVATTLSRITDDDALLGLRRAVVARRDAVWAAALLRRGWDAALVPALPRAEREAVVLDRVRASGDKVGEVVGAIATLDAPWSPDTSVALVGRLRQARTAPTLVSYAMPHLVAGLHPAALDALERWQRALGDGDRALATHLRNLLQLHSVKRSISEAFR